MKTRPALLLLPLLAAARPAAAQVVPDRATATTVTQGASGRIAVGIAPVDGSGISRNTYAAFSVPRAGVDLDNRGIDASTIVNEVTSARRSIIQGTVAVLGSRAHVVLANPNGITIDGGSFVNTGGVALSAGPLRYEAAGTPGRFDAVVSTGAGDIAVTGAGLSGAMTTLQLVAGRIRIDGPVRNGAVSPDADVALVAGRSEVRLDSQVSPLTTLRPWASRRDLGGAAKQVLVDVTPRGSLSASRVGIAVSARGAGVSYAGRGQAAIGDFTITAGGRVTTRGAVLTSEKGLKIASAGIAVLNDRRRQSRLASISQGVTLRAQRDIDIRGAISGSQRTGDDPDSKGGVTLKAGGRIGLLSETAGRLALAFAAKDDLSVEARSLANDTGRLLSNATTVLRVGGALANGAGRRPPAVETQTLRRRSGGLLGALFGLRRRIAWTRIDAGEARIPGQTGTIAGKAVDLEAGRLENGGEIDALDGSLLVEAGTVSNTAAYTGSLSLAKHCGIVCWSRGASTLATAGGRINAAGSADIRASGAVENSGEIVAYGNLSITAPGVIGRALAVPQIADRPAGFYDAFAGSIALVSLAPTGGSFLAPAGTVTIASPAPVVLAGGTAEGQVATQIPSGIDRRQDLKADFPGGLHHPGLLRFWLD